MDYWKAKSGHLEVENKRLQAENARLLAKTEDTLNAVRALPEKWRYQEKDSYASRFSLCGYDCAEELEAALRGNGDE
jgi:hypothetical protein